MVPLLRKGRKVKYYYFRIKDSTHAVIQKQFWIVPELYIYILPRSTTIVICIQPLQKINHGLKIRDVQNSYKIKDHFCRFFWYILTKLMAIKTFQILLFYLKMTVFCPQNYHTVNKSSKCFFKKRVISDNYGYFVLFQ